MRYWRNRDISDRLISDRASRQERARNEPNDTQLTGGVGFWFDSPIEYED